MTAVAAPSDSAFPPPLQGLPLTITVRVGTAQKTVKELATLTEGALVVLDSTVESPVEVCVEGRVIAHGQLIESEEGGGLAVKIIDLVGAEEEG